MPTEFKEVCEKEAKFRIENQFPGLSKLEKDKAIKEMSTRLFNMYDDLFEANHMNTIAKDCVLSVTL